MLKSWCAILVVLLGVYLFCANPGEVLQSAIKYIPFLENVNLGPYAESKKINNKNNRNKIKLFTEELLKKYFDKENGLYLSILGEVYDVTKGEKHYGPGGSYNFFTGRDASRAFVTGDFTENGLIDDVLDLDPQDIRGLFKWVTLYKEQYKYKGKLIGRYFDSKGNPTTYRHKVENKLKFSERDERAKHEEKLRLPPCNSEWNVEQGTRVWCTKLSGGIQRDWIGVPRMFYSPGSESYRCACINLEEAPSQHLGNIKEYPGCDPQASSCFVSN